MKKLGVMGGTFNPIHIGHLIAAQEVASKLELDRVIFIPAGNPPHKDINSEIMPSDRLEMVELATKGNDIFETSDIEINRQGRTYTVDTLKELKQLYNAEIYFIIGFDTLMDMDSWRMVDKVFEMANFVVVNRGNHDIQQHQEMERKKIVYNAKLFEVDIPDIQISSTQIRERVKKGETIKYLVPEAVEKYIFTKGLYKNELR